LTVEHDTEFKGGPPLAGKVSPRFPIFLFRTIRFFGKIDHPVPQNEAVFL